jgi:hypothetical protein
MPITFLLHMCICDEGDPAEFADDACSYHSRELPQDPGSSQTDTGCMFAGSAGPETCQIASANGCTAPGP